MEKEWEKLRGRLKKEHEGTGLENVAVQSNVDHIQEVGYPADGCHHQDAAAEVGAAAY